MPKTYDVAVIGAGVFGAWTAYYLRRAGAEVLLIDAYGPGNSRASSGGESRMIRLGYGPDEIYTRSAQRSLELWKQLFAEVGPHAVPLFQNTGILWLAREHDAYCAAVLTTLRDVGARFERLDRDQLVQRHAPVAGLDAAERGRADQAARGELVQRPATGHPQAADPLPDQGLQILVLLHTQDTMPYEQSWLPLTHVP